MEVQEAFKNIQVAVADYKGTLKEHMALQESIKTLDKLVNPTPEEDRKLHTEESSPKNNK